MYRSCRIERAETSQGDARRHDVFVPDDLSPTPADEITARLATFEAQLRAELGDRASVRRRLVADGTISSVEITPSNPRALHLCWLEMFDELGFQAGHNGGRWELDRTDEDVALVELLVRAVIAGRVIETFTLPSLLATAPQRVKPATRAASPRSCRYRAGSVGVSQFDTSPSRTHAHAADSAHNAGCRAAGTWTVAPLAGWSGTSTCSHAHTRASREARDIGRTAQFSGETGRFRRAAYGRVRPGSRR